MLMIWFSQHFAADILAKLLHKFGVVLNIMKTKMVLNFSGEKCYESFIHVNNRIIENVEDFVYLRGLIFMQT